jgi:hypothetical protein
VARRRIDGRGQAHLNVSSVPAEDTQAKTADAPIARRSPGGGQPAASSLADGSAGERDTLAKGDHALLLFHSPTKTMVLCDEGHRCIALAKLTWDETARRRQALRVQRDARVARHDQRHGQDLERRQD